MADKFFDVQAALLYNDVPVVDFAEYLERFKESAQNHEIPGAFKVLPGASNETTLSIAGAGVHATLSLQDTPCDAEEFSLALRAPILRHKNFDFKSTIRDHQSAIVITVGDGETPLPFDARELMAQAGVVRASDPMLKMSVLHVLMQCMAETSRPMMVSFCPSQSLLCPQELEAVSDMALPLPILFHPFPFSNGKTEGGQPRIGMAAIHAPLLIGAELELENIPNDFPIATRINLLATLIQNKRSGNLPLEDGDGLQPDGAYNLTVRHEPGSTEGGPHRIVVTFDDHVPQATAQDQKGQQAFQDRIARLKKRDAHDGDLGAPAMPTGHGSAESPDDLRARVQETINPGGHGNVRSGFLTGPIKLVAIAAVVGLAFVLGPSEDVAEMATSQATSINNLMQTLSGGEIISARSASTSTTDMVREVESSIRTRTSP